MTHPQKKQRPDILDEPVPEWLSPAVFDSTPRIKAGFSLRHEGYSEAPFASLNIGLSTGDRQETVLKNRRLLLRAAGLPHDRLATGGQVHGTRIRHFVEPESCSGYDGLTTTTPGVVLGIIAADCAAVLLADVENGIIGACHSGWRGTLGQISALTVEEMVRLGARTTSIKAYVSPCISVENFEVGMEVAEQFDPRYVRTFPGKEKPHVDIKAVITDQLAAAGVPYASIEVSPHCTFAETDKFFSYRAENGRTGRMMGFIALDPDV